MEDRKYITSNIDAPFEEIELNGTDGIRNEGFEHAVREITPTLTRASSVKGRKDVENGDTALAKNGITGKSGNQKIQLIYTQVEKLPPRDFYSEVRPMLDVEHYVYDMVVLLDIDTVTTEDIFSDLLLKMFPEKKLQTAGAIEDCKRLLFADADASILADVMQGSTGTESDSLIVDPNWLIAMCELPIIRKTRIGMVRLSESVNFGPAAASVRFLGLVVGATEQKATKSPVETARTLATLLSDSELRLELRSARDEESIKQQLVDKSLQLNKPVREAKAEMEPMCNLGSLFWENMARRSKYYMSDYMDGVSSVRTLSKVLSTTIFLFFSIILPTVAFGALGSRNTGGLINENRAVVGQVIGGLIWAVISGQPMLIIATTALVSLYSKVVYEISVALDEDFYTLYAWVGVWSTVFLTVYAFTGIGNLVKYSTRSVEEIFTLFITTCFVVDAVRDMVEIFAENYHDVQLKNTSLFCNLTDFPANNSLSCGGSRFVENPIFFSCGFQNVTWANETFDCVISDFGYEFALLECDGWNISCNGSTLTTDWLEEIEGKSTCLASFLLMALTVSTSVTVANFRSSPYLVPLVREIISDYALPFGVILWSFVASRSEVPLTALGIEGFTQLTPASMSTSGQVIGVSFALGFAASILLFMDQNITSQILNAPTNKLKKGGAPHLDILVIGVVNLILSIYGLPWMHAVLPHSPLHVMCLADIEERVIDGQMRQVVIKARETRVTGILCHLLMIIILAACPSIFNWIPVAVLDGLFLYCAVMSLRGNSFFERLLLIFTQQSQYPPSHYIRKCPQSLVHWFTLIEVIQLLVICFIGFAPWSYLQMLFPLALAVLIPVRHFVVPFFIDPKYLPALESFE